MPIKGQYTAGVAVLFDRIPTTAELRNHLEAAGLDVVKETPAGEAWQFGGPSLVVAFRPDVNGYVSVDVVDRPWPDHMGDPNTDPTTMGAWSMACFGPFAFPGGLRRAAQQTWSWPSAKGVAESHAAFVRLRTSYVFGGDPQAHIFPPEYDPTSEVHFLTAAADAVMNVTGATAFFNPNGEVLLPREQLTEKLKWAEENQMPPLDLISNERLFNVDAGWMVMDTCGNSQFDSLDWPEPFPDLECCFLRGGPEPGEVAGFLRNTTLYVWQNGPAFKDGDTIDGPDGRWRARRRRALLNPPRATLRFALDPGPPLPDALAAENEQPLGG